MVVRRAEEPLRRHGRLGITANHIFLAALVVIAGGQLLYFTFELGDARWPLYVLKPGLFIPALEESTLIVDVGRWVLHEACRQTAAWQAKHRRVDISVNVSAKQLETDVFVSDVREALWRSGIPTRLSGPEVDDARRAA